MTLGSSHLALGIGELTSVRHGARCDRIAFEQALTVSFACRVIRREALVFGTQGIARRPYRRSLPAPTRTVN
jgi:hypothetical protein